MPKGMQYLPELDVIDESSEIIILELDRRIIRKTGDLLVRI